MICFLRASFLSYSAILRTFALLALLLLYAAFIMFAPAIIFMPSFLRLCFLLFCADIYIARVLLRHI